MAEERNDIWILGAVVSIESGSAQGQGDVAQSIYNRVASSAYHNTIYDVLTVDNHYQPAFVNPNVSSGRGAKVAPVWKAVKDEATAIKAIKYYYKEKGRLISDADARDQLRETIRNIQDPQIIANAASHVGDRTDFRGANVLEYNPANLTTRGGPNDNRFGGGTQNGTAAQVPSTLTSVITTDDDRDIVPPPLPVTGDIIPTRGTDTFYDYTLFSDIDNDQLDSDISNFREKISELDFIENSSDLWTDEQWAEYNKLKAPLDELIKEKALRTSGGDCVSNQNPSKSWTFKETPECTQFIKSAVFAEAVKTLTQERDLPNPCGSNQLSRINTELTKFFETLKGIKKYANLYVNGTINKIQNVTNLIRNSASIIGAVLKSITQRVRNWIIGKIRAGIEDLINNALPTIAKELKDIGIQAIIDNIFCAFQDILRNIADMVIDFLSELVGKVVNIPFCAAQQFTNSLINNLAATIDKQIGPLLNQISDILGGISTAVSGAFEALDFILGFQSFLCAKPNCPEINKFKASPWAGPTEAMIDDFNNFLPIPSDTELVSSINRSIGNIPIFGSTLGEYDDTIPPEHLLCDTAPFKCGPPSIELFGGGGFGAAGRAVVDELGSIMGVDIINGGSGYSSPPFVTILDPCDNGNYASAYSVIDDNGVVIDIVMVNTGTGYLTSPSGLDEFGLPSDDQVDEKVNDYVVCLSGFRIKSTGIGYDVNSTLSITPPLEGVEASIRMTEQGQIVSIDLLGRICGVTQIPEIDIVSDTGNGVNIEPIFDIIPVNEDNDLVPDDVITDEPDVSIEINTGNLLDPMTREVISINPNEVKGIDDIRKLIDQRKIVRVVDCVR